MKFTLWVGVLAGLCVGGAAYWAESAARRQLSAREHAWNERIQAGDLVFQDIDCGRRCQLIRLITESPYTHVGVVLVEDGERVVWEALGPVGPTPLENWVRRGTGQNIALFRPHTPPSEERQRQMREALQTMRGRPYDANYQWDDERIYCSELVAKMEEVLGHPFEPRPMPLGRFAAEIARLSEGELTADTPVVSPADLVRSGRYAELVNELVP